MKKQIVLIGILIFSILELSSQVFVQGQGGYQFPSATSQSPDVVFINQTFLEEGGVWKGQEFFSLGQGHSVSLGAGYLFDNTIGLSVNAVYHGSSQMHADIVNEILQEQFTLSYQAEMYYVEAGVVVRADLPANFLFMLEGGPMVGSGEISEKREGEYQGDQVLIKKSYSEDLDWGWLINVDLGYPVFQNLQVYLSGTFVNFNFAPGRGVLDSWIVNQEDLKTGLPTSYIEKDFVKDFNSNDVSTSPDEPETRLKEKWPFSSVGVQIGLRYSFK